MSDESIDRTVVRAVRPLRISTGPNEHAPEVDPGNVIGEAPLTIDIRDVGAYTIMCTPADTLALAVGFLFTESIIDGVADIDVLGHCEDDPGVVRVQLADPSRARKADRNLLVVSSCGLCGSETVAG